MQIKKVLKFVLAAFVIFYLFTRPANAAEAVNSVVDGVVHGGNQLAVFFTSIAT